MIVSMYRLSRTDLKALRITDAYSLHRTVYSLFPQTEEDGRDFLYADKGGDFTGRKILLLSRRNPQQPKFGTVESKLVPDLFLSYECYGFEVIVNPVKRENCSRKLIPIRGREELTIWFLAKSTSFGIQVDPKSLQVQDVGVQRFQKEGVTVTHGTATFQGKLRVTDRAAFIKSFQEGIGRAKGFGFGLLQIVPLR